MNPLPFIGPSSHVHQAGKGSIVSASQAERPCVRSTQTPPLYLGKHGSAKSIEAYSRFLAEHCPAADGSTPPAVLAAIKADLTIVELIDRYWQHAQRFYRRHDSSDAAAAAKSDAAAIDRRITTGTAKNQRPALRRLNQFYGSTPAAKFGPLALKPLHKT